VPSKGGFRRLNLPAPCMRLPDDADPVCSLFVSYRRSFQGMALKMSAPRRGIELRRAAPARRIFSRFVEVSPERSAQRGTAAGAVSRVAMRWGMAAAIGDLAMSGGASSQTAKRIEQLAPELEKIISASEPIQDLADGFGGPLGPAEGPVWWKEGGYLVFSDIHNNKRMKYEPGKGVSLVLEPTNRANGLTRDLQGRLLACEHDSRRVTRQEKDGSITVVANSFQGRQLNRPNDVVVKSDGCIYFTDPWTNPNPPQ